MPIPRLAPDANDLTVSITINKKLRPYFTLWFQREKGAGETPEQFAIRKLKEAALNDYIHDTAQTEVNTIEQVKQASMDELGQDVQSLSVEVDG